MTTPSSDPAPAKPSRPIGEWLHLLLPNIEPLRWPDGCWVAQVMTRSPEHHPPLYWLGRALDEVEALGLGELLASRLLAAHGAEACAGWTEEDQRAQDVLSEACALAWTCQHLGRPELLVLQEATGDGPEATRTSIRVPALEAQLAPVRLRSARAMEQLFAQVQAAMEQAAHDLPPSASRVVYLDLPLNLQAWSQDVGYAAPITEPLQMAVRHYGAEEGLGYVLTRPFQWGTPIEVWF